MARNIATVGGERQINAVVPPLNADYVTGVQDNPVVIALTNGNFLVAFGTPSGTTDIVVQEFTANGTRVSGPTVIATISAATFDVSALSGNGSVATYQAGNDIAIRISTPSNAAVNFTAVGTLTGAVLSDPTIAVFGNGNYFVAAEDDGADRIRFSVVNAAGTANVVTDGFVVNPGPQVFHPDAAAVGNNAAVVWSQSSIGASSIQLQTYDHNGAPVDAETVDAAASTNMDLPSVAALTDGRFVIVWQSTPTGGESDLKGRIYNPTTQTFSGAEFIISSRSGNQTQPAVSNIPDGGFLVTWSDDSHQLGDGSGLAIHARRFDANGTPTGDEFRVNSGANLDQRNASVAVNGAGDVFTAWTDLSGTPDTSPSGIQGQFAKVATEVVNGTEGPDNIVTYGLSETINGLGGNDTIQGVAGNDIINGGTGADNMLGGVGNDTFFVDNPFDDVAESAGQGADTILTAVSYGLAGGRSIEAFRTTNAAGTVAIALTGNELGQQIEGNNGNNVIDGKGGADVMTGRGGNDTYVVDIATDTVSETGGSGIDIVHSSVTFSLADAVHVIGAVENLSLTGAGAINGTGNALNNVLTGNSGANTLDGGLGDDTLDGGLGNDSLVGGAGNDTYALANGTDSITDTGGIDTITSTITRSLASFGTIEHLTLLGSAANGTGNALANTVTGNAAANVLDGGVGIDALIGGAGNDTYVLANSTDTVNDTAGIDTITSTITRSLASYTTIEKLTLLGTAVINGTGNGLANTIIGNAAANVLDGGAGIDRLEGGAGNDTYTIDSASEVLVEISGIDLVRSTVTKTLATGFEKLTLLLAGNINGIGNASANIITGNGGINTLLGLAANDRLVGLGGNDTLDGGVGIDRLEGGAGNDTYTIDSASEVLVEISGIDLVRSTVTKTLAVGFENLTLLGVANLIGTGNAAANVLTGNTGANILTGLDGNDTILGGAGIDRLSGGLGKDTMTGGAGTDDFDFNVVAEMGKTAATRDVIVDFTLGDDLDFSTIDANGAGAGNTAFSFLAANGATFTGVAGQVRWQNFSSLTLVEGDTNGDRVADFQIQLTGSKNLTAADFIL